MSVITTEELQLFKTITFSHITLSYIRGAPTSFRQAAGHVSADLLSGAFFETAKLPPDARVWWIARCFVREEMRSKKIGTALLKELQDTVGEDYLIVAPGGYGSDPLAQRRFYENSGFKEVDKDGLLLWKREIAEVQNNE